MTKENEDTKTKTPLNKSNVEGLVSCKHCGEKPTKKSVFGTGAYYKCKACNFPTFQFPIAQTEGMQMEQWNKLNS